MSVSRLAALAVFSAITAAAQSTPIDEFFEIKVRPVFDKNCSACHNPKLKSAGLDLTTAAGFRAGATSGPVVSKEDPDNSRLLLAIRQQGTVKMPPMGKLPDRQIAEIAEWVKLGARWPETSSTVVATGKFSAEQRKSIEHIGVHPEAAGHAETFIKMVLKFFDFFSK